MLNITIQIFGTSLPSQIKILYKSIELFFKIFQIFDLFLVLIAGKIPGKNVQTFNKKFLPKSKPLIKKTKTFLKNQNKNIINANA